MDDEGANTSLTPNDSCPAVKVCKARARMSIGASEERVSASGTNGLEKDAGGETQTAIKLKLLLRLLDAYDDIENDCWQYSADASKVFEELVF